ncbi:hypothetical protein C8R43DRAFT_1123350 [Mycena crocata]|nr:hypothetical protein C8R43DRAFT_1123350 [Mycena crocata]
MASRNTGASSSQTNAPFALKPRRTVMACSNCRKRKIRCITPEQPPKNPCARCVKRGFTCEYVAAPEPDYYSGSHSQSPPDHNYTPPDPPDPAPAHTSTPTWHMPATTSSFFQGPLPYTGPPPLDRVPRFSGSNYPDLSLQGAPQSQYVDPRQLMRTNVQFPNHLSPSPQPYNLGASDPSSRTRLPLPPSMFGNHQYYSEYPNTSLGPPTRRTSQSG